MRDATLMVAMGCFLASAIFVGVNAILFAVVTLPVWTRKAVQVFGSPGAHPLIMWAILELPG